MLKQTLLNYAARLFFVGASVVIVLAFMEWIAQFLRFSLISYMYKPGRLLELAATLLVFVIVVLLHEIRDELRKNRS